MRVNFVQFRGVAVHWVELNYNAKMVYISTVLDKVIFSHFALLSFLLLDSS